MKLKQNKHACARYTSNALGKHIHSLLFQTLGWNPKTGTPNSIDQINIKATWPCSSMPLCLLLSAFFLLASAQIWLGSVASYVSVCLHSECLPACLWAPGVDSTGTKALCLHFLISSHPTYLQAQGAHPTTFMLEFHANSWTTCVGFI